MPMVRYTIWKKSLLTNLNIHLPSCLIWHWFRHKEILLHIKAEDHSVLSPWPPFTLFLEGWYRHTLSWIWSMVVSKTELSIRKNQDEVEIYFLVMLDVFCLESSGTVLWTLFLISKLLKYDILLSKMVISCVTAVSAVPFHFWLLICI